MYSQSLLKCLLLFSKVSVGLVLWHTINSWLSGENLLKKIKFSYCHRLMTFRIVRFHCSKEASQQLSEIAYCSLLKQYIPSLYSCFNWTVIFYRFLWRSKALCYLVQHVKHFKHIPCIYTTECRKCFAENWTCATISQEINHNSKSIYPTYKIIISLDRG